MLFGYTEIKKCEIGNTETGKIGNTNRKLENMVPVIGKIVIIGYTILIMWKYSTRKLSNITYGNRKLGNKKI
jgi:hypothetical protein